MATQRYNTGSSQWESCSGTSDCFGGFKRRLVEGTLSNTAYSTIGMEIDLRCDGADIAQFYIACRATVGRRESRFKKVRAKVEEKVGASQARQNANLRIWYNLAEIAFNYDVTCEQEGSQYANFFYGQLQKTWEVSSDRALCD